MKKFLIAFSVVFVSLFSSFIPVEASSVEPLAFDTVPKFPDNFTDYENYIIYDIEGTMYLLGFSNSKITDFKFSGGFISFKGSRTWCKLENDSWSQCGTEYATNGYPMYMVTAVHYNNFDIRNISGDIIYPKKPVPSPPAPLHKVVEEVEMEGAMSIVVEVLPIVVLSIVSYLGLRKAFRTLLHLLRGC